MADDKKAAAGKPKPGAKQFNPEFVNDAESEEMFQMWCQVNSRMGAKGTGLKAVAAAFNRSYTTVCRAAKRGNWRQRHQKILDGIRKGNDKKIVREQVTNLVLVRAIRNKVCGEALRPNKDLKASVNEIVSVIRLEEELTGNLPVVPDDGDVSISKEQVQEAMQVIKKMGKELLEKIAGAMVKAGKTDER